jgi:hypothetical protein
MSYRWTWRVYVGRAAIQLAIGGLAICAFGGVGLLLGRSWMSWSAILWIVGLALVPSLLSFLADRAIWYSIDHYAPKNCPHCSNQIDVVEWV